VSESDIQRAILDAFQAMGVLAFRINSGKVRTRGGWYQGAPAGFPDILVVVPPSGRLLGIEVKDRNGDERESQVRMHDALSRHGAAVRTCWTVEDAVRAYLEAKDAPRGV
jgi:hypothetical protein